MIHPLNDMGSVDSNTEMNPTRLPTSYRFGFASNYCHEVGSTVWLPTTSINVKYLKKTTRVHLSLVCPST